MSCSNSATSSGGEGAPGLADGVPDVSGGDEFLAVLEQDALEGQ
jgi:hypothetical protein